MSVVSVQRLTERGGSLGKTSKITQTYLIRTDSRDDGYFEVRAAIEAEVGTFLTAHPDNSFYTRREISLSAPSALHWTAKVSWSTEQISSQDMERDQYPNPTDRRMQISIASQETQKYVWKDKDDVPLVNTAGEPIEPLPINFTDVIINIKANIDNYDATWLTTYSNTVNATDVSVTNGRTTLNIEAGYGLLKSINISENQLENGYEYYEANMSVHVTHDTEYLWKTMVINEGFHRRSGTKLVPFFELDTDGNDTEDLVTTPVKITEDGLSRLEAGSEPFLLEFETYNVTDWKLLPFFSAV